MGHTLTLSLMALLTVLLVNFGAQVQKIAWTLCDGGLVGDVADPICLRLLF